MSRAKGRNMSEVVDQTDRAASADGAGPLLPPEEHVLSTLERDGRRRWLYPRLVKGKWWRRRRALAYVLMVIFVLVPYLRIDGRPFIRLDIGARQFTVLGETFLPTDTLLLALLLLTAFVSIFLFTAITGRVWCGWACPQTVYMEFLFRPIDRLFEGTRGRGGMPKRKLSPARQVARFIVYLLLCSFLAHTFLAYFVGPEKLAVWMRSTPWQHPVGFLVMIVTTGLLTYDFYFFREQTCLIACPYGRFQSVMLDRHSLIVAYDFNRGEPRRKGKIPYRKSWCAAGKCQPPQSQAGSGVELSNDGGLPIVGDCVDCFQCVRVCPTGIDIRDGLQMECINCTQCIDACDEVMERVGLPPGLIRYTSQSALAGERPRLLRVRTVVYPMILVALVSALGFAVAVRQGFDARVVRGKGAPFVNIQPGRILNNFSVRLVNRTHETRTYRMELVRPAGADLQVLEPELLSVEPAKSHLVPIQIEFPAGLTFGDGQEPVELHIVDDAGNERNLKFRLIGPKQ
ncbi:MAG: cytochrome c oxidase accessory protein CcoG [Planctomycetota bacterium]|nr:MAG: cytochrome c oxidase accessory protein CcoG [Planctomycetota bacterium]